MTTPDYLQQVVISGRRRPRAASAPGATGALSPAVTGAVWAGLDFLSALVGGLIAFRIRLIPETTTAETVLMHLVPMPPVVAVMYLLLFGVYLVFFARVYGLYGMAQTQSGLHEQRMTMQATLTAGLLLCGGLAEAAGAAVSAGAGDEERSDRGGRASGPCATQPPGSAAAYGVPVQGIYLADAAAG